MTPAALSDLPSTLDAFGLPATMAVYTGVLVLLAVCSLAVGQTQPGLQAAASQGLPQGIVIPTGWACNVAPNVVRPSPVRPGSFYSGTRRTALNRRCTAAAVDNRAVLGGSGGGGVPISQSQVLLTDAVSTPLLLQTAPPELFAPGIFNGGPAPALGPDINCTSPYEAPPNSTLPFWLGTVTSAFQSEASQLLL